MNAPTTKPTESVDLDFSTAPDYSAWWSANGPKLRNHSIFTKGAVIWNAALIALARRAPAQQEADEHDHHIYQLWEAESKGDTFRNTEEQILALDYFKAGYEARATQPAPGAGQEPVGWASRRVDSGGYGSLLHSSKNSAEVHLTGNGPGAPEYEIVPVFAAPVSAPGDERASSWFNAQDGVDGHHPDYGNGVFFTHDCRRDAAPAAQAVEPAGQQAVAPMLTVKEAFEAVGGWYNGGELGYPSFGSANALWAYTDKMQRNAVARALASQPSAGQAAAGPVVDMLLDVVRLAHDAMDNTEDDGNGLHWHKPDFDALSEAIDKLDALPDDQPGYVMGPAAKARWALRGAAPTVAAAGPAPSSINTPEFRELLGRLESSAYADGVYSDGETSADVISCETALIAHIEGYVRAKLAAAPVGEKGSSDA
jgi:hypothetical protein